MLVQQTNVSVEEFERIVMLPENAERLLELIDGEISEVVSNSISSIIAAYICGVIVVFVRQSKLGYVSGADGGYQIGNERYIPDCAFISKTKLSKPTTESYVSIPPDLAVEVLSPSNTPDEMTIKVDNYLRAGVVVWVVSPEAQRVVVHRPDAPPKTYNIDETLDGGNVLPGFTLPVRDIFAE
jgi:Uma2 family endonuclease